MAPAGLSVLVVDDERDIRESLVAVLCGEGYTVASAANGREALDRVDAGARPTLVLVDLMMPVMDGWRFLDAARRHPDLATTPIVAVSAFTRDPDTSGVFSAYLQKPFSVAALLAEVRRHCG